jgi:hypothetical protein
MNTQTISNKTTFSKAEPQEQNLPSYRRLVQYGLLAGLGMSLFLLWINSSVSGIHTGWSMVKYLILGGFPGLLMYQNKKASPSGYTFKYGIILGLITSVVAAPVLIAASTLMSSVGLEAIVTERYNLRANNLLNTMTNNGVFLFDSMVFGMILNFMWLQLFKDAKPA